MLFLKTERLLPSTLLPGIKEDAFSRGLEVDEDVAWVLTERVPMIVLPF